MWKVGLVASGVIMLVASLFLWFRLPPFGGLVALVPLALVFLPWFRIGTIQDPPETVLGYCAHHFRLAGHLVAGGPGEITVRLGWWAAVKIRARPDARGSVLAYQVYAGPGGLAALSLLFLIAWPAPFAVIPIMYIFYRVVTQIEARVAPMVRVGKLPEAFRADDVQVLLVATLGEAQRLARESYESHRDGYQDVQGILILGEILGWLLLFLGLSFVLVDPDWGQRIRNALLIATGAMLAFGIFVGLLVRQRFLPFLARSREWSSRLEKALRAEASQERTSKEPSGTLDLLLQASREVPAWIAAQRKAGLSRDWGMWLVLFILWMESVQFLIYAIPVLWVGDALGVVLLSIGVGLAVAADRLYRRWRRKRDEELARLQEGWRLQFDRLHAGMERFLQEL